MWGNWVGSGQLDGPAGLACDQDDNLYVVDSRNHRIQVFTKDGKYLASCGKYGSGPVEFNMPWGIHIDDNDDLFVADWKNNRVQKLTKNGAFLMELKGEGQRALNHPTTSPPMRKGMSMCAIGPTISCAFITLRVICLPPLLGMPR